MTRNLEAQGRDRGWARDSRGKLVELNSSDDVLCVALANQPKQQVDDSIRIEREAGGRRWLVVDGKNIYSFADEKAAFLLMRHLKSGA
jgi:hypothetical protein